MLVQWLLIAICSFNLAHSNTLAVKHPLHVSVTEINYEPGEQILEITVKLFTDDYETILRQLYGKKTDFSVPGYQGEMAIMVKKYINDHLSIYLDGKKVNFYYLGHEIIDMAVNNYFQAENIKPFEKVRIENTCLYDLYDDQTSVCHFVVAGKRQSTKVTKPDSKIEFTFAKPNPFH
ncbi:MAG TPA: DUF6702 family protein [Chitinophagales bacterium]|nr:DUF6702 family protein [Chitinophagales bacterium]